MHGLSCSVACGIFPDQGSNPCPLHWQADSFFFFFNFIATLFLSFFIFGCVGSSVRARAFSSYGKRGPPFIAVQGPLFIAVRGPFTTAAPPVAGHRLQTRRLSSRGPRAQPLRGMRDPPRPGVEPVSPAPAGRPSTTAGRRILNHCTTREVPKICFSYFNYSSCVIVTYEKLSFFLLDFKLPEEKKLP